MKETWKDIPGYEGLYQVSDMGRVRSLDRIIVDASKNRTRKLNGKILKPCKDAKGYLIVDLSKGGRKKTIKVHKLVAIAFLNHKRCGMEEVVDHIDNNQQNNRLDNLQLTTQRRNTSKDKSGVSQYTGVNWNKGAQKWQARIWIDGKRKSLGYFHNEYDAHLAYQNELSKISA